MKKRPSLKWKVLAIAIAVVYLVFGVQAIVGEENDTEDVMETEVVFEQLTPTAGTAQVAEEARIEAIGDSEDEEEPEEATVTEEPSEPEEPEVEEETYPIRSFDWDSEESYLLAKIAMAEAGNQDTEGKALVILTVINRVWDSRFPDSIEKVIYQKGQFSPVASGRFERVEPDQDCWDALDLVMSGWDESQGCLYFESKSASTWHEDNLKFLFKHQDHYFYTERD